MGDTHVLVATSFELVLKDMWVVVDTAVDCVVLNTDPFTENSVHSFS